MLRPVYGGGQQCLCIFEPIVLPCIERSVVDLNVGFLKSGR